MIDIRSTVTESLLASIKICKHIVSKRKNYTKIDFEQMHRDYPEKKVVVYSCITGNYDNVKKPLFSYKNIDYILFSENFSEKKNKWIYKELPEKIQDLNFKEKNAYMKMHPHEFFEKEYDYSIYIDGKLKIVGDLHPLINKTAKYKSGTSLFEHAKRKDSYEEAKHLINIKKGNVANIKQQIIKMKKENFPQNTGLFEMAIIVSDLKNENNKKLLSDWWEEFYKSKSMRDQYSWPYILWKNNMSKEDIDILGFYYEDNPKWIVKGHKN